MDATSAPVTHNSVAQRFELNSNGVTAIAEYRRELNRVIFHHTFVPPELRGQGIAEQLVRTALAWARAEKLQVVPECSYVARLIERHHEYSDLL
jgi:uncharacterized protein